MPWVCCAFGNFSWKLTLSVISMLISGQAVSKCTTAPPTSATGKARFEKPNILFRFAFCCFQQSSAQQLIIEKQATSGEQEHHLCEALLPPRLSNLYHNWGERLASEHWVVNLLKLMKRFTTSPTPSPSTGASRRECSSTQCLERWWLRCVTKRLVTLIVIAAWSRFWPRWSYSTPLSNCGQPSSGFWETNSAIKNNHKPMDSMMEGRDWDHILIDGNVIDGVLALMLKHTSQQCWHMSSLTNKVILLLKRPFFNQCYGFGWQDVANCCAIFFCCIGCEI